MATFGSNRVGLTGSTLSKSVITAIQASNQGTIPGRTLNQTVFVDLNDNPAIANIVREGYRVPSILPDSGRLDVLLSGLKAIKPTNAPRVLDQGIAAGTRVSVGTEVDLILAPREDINVGIFDDIHVEVTQTSIGELLDRVKEQTQLQGLVLQYENAAEVEEVDRGIMSDLIVEFVGIEINEEKPGQGFSNAYNSLRAAYAFI